MRQALLISHDIGGFRPTFAYLSEKYPSVRCYVKGPALEEAVHHSADIIETLAEIEINDYDIYVSTGWETSFEKKCMKFLQLNKINWIAALDNWNEYSCRFLLQGKNYLPNQIIVFDKYARKLCNSIFPNIECKLVPNIFDLNFVRSYENLELAAGAQPKFDLFLADPISDHYGDKVGYNEFDQIHYILKKLNDRYSKSYPLRVRPHPSENGEKYEYYIKENNLKHVCVSYDTLVADLHSAGSVFGDSSYAMHLAMLVGKKVFCSIPLESINSTLPHQSLRYLRETNV